jgi:ATP-binding cassette subfamily F protein 3
MGAPLLEKDIRNYLGRFLFSGEDHYKKVSVLSGGERGRLSLAKLGLLDANFLLLDEPSNHLDIPGQEILQQVLTEFEGTILMVSHDRYLINALATQIWDIEPATHSLKIFKGSYQEYIGRVDPVVDNAEENSSTVVELQQIEEKPASAESKKISKFERQRIQTRINVLEDKIIDLEEQLEKLGEILQNPPSDADKIQQIGEDYAYLESALQEKMAEWEVEHNRLVGER